MRRISDSGLDRIRKVAWRDASEVWAMHERLKELMGADMLLDEYARAMSKDELEANIEWVIQMHDIRSEFKDFSDEEDEEEEEDF